MAQPTAYEPQHDYSSELGTKHGTHLDEEFEDIATTTDEIRTNLALIQRDDGRLKNASVHPDALDSATLALIASDWTPQGLWATSTVYAVGDVVESSGVGYVCAVAHTSGTFATDHTAGKWIAIASAASSLAAASVTFTPVGTIAASDAQAAIAEAASDALQKASNLSDLASAATARTNLAVPSTTELQSLTYVTATAVGGTVDAITGTFSPAISANANNRFLAFEPAGANTTTTPTFAAGTAGAKTICKGNGIALLPGDLQANTLALIRFDSTLDKWVLLNPTYPAVAPGSSGELWTSGGASSAPGFSASLSSGARAFKNRIINGDFSIAQRGTSFTSTTTPANSDDTFLLDRWILLSDGNDIVDVTQETTTVPSNQLYAITLDVETANAKFGLLQVIEQKNCIDLIGQTVTVQFKARKGASNATAETLRAALISWSSTADSVTSDVVSAWNSAGTDPTLATNWTYENTPSNLTLSTSFQTFSVSAAVDTSGAKNIGVLIWCDDTDATVADLIHIADVQIEKGSVATEFERRPIQVERDLCEWYCEVIDGFAANDDICSGFVSSTTVAMCTLPFKRKRVDPTIALSAFATFAIAHEASQTTLDSAVAGSVLSNKACRITATVTAGFTAGQGCALRAATTAASIRLEAEL